MIIMCYLKLIWVFFLVVTTECSMVLDSTNQKWIYFNDYCATTKYCPEGTHVMCTYYDPVNVMGPLCAKGKNITITDEFVKEALKYVNDMRKLVAHGEEFGKNNEPLPRSYGMMRVKWDAELATFAQIWANQCIKRHDLCRATKKFPNPGQFIGSTKFTYPDWNFIIKYTPALESGFNYKMVQHALNETMTNLYNEKEWVTKEIIYSSPDDVTYALEIDHCNYYYAVLSEQKASKSKGGTFKNLQAYI